MLRFIIHTKHYAGRFHCYEFNLSRDKEQKIRLGSTVNVNIGAIDVFGQAREVRIRDDVNRGHSPTISIMGDVLHIETLTFQIVDVPLDRSLVRRGSISERCQVTDQKNCCSQEHR